MKTAILALALAAAAGPALAADVSGRWKVDGDVDHKRFTVYCTFKQTGEALSGVCHDTSPTGKAHPLTAGAVTGDRISFTYQSNFLITRFDAMFNGVISGDNAKGEAKAAGRAGTFTAKRA